MYFFPLVSNKKNLIVKELFILIFRLVQKNVKKNLPMTAIKSFESSHTFNKQLKSDIRNFFQWTALKQKPLKSSDL